MVYIGKFHTDKPIIDLHVHVGPEFIPRRYSIKSLADEAQSEAFGFVAKNHFQATTSWAAMINMEYNIPIIGSITLNKSVGGINHEAIRGALSGLKTNILAENNKLSKRRFIVWMPTIHAEAHLDQYNRKDILAEWGSSSKDQKIYPKGEGLTILEKNNLKYLSPETVKVLELIAKEDLILATGHLSAKEVELLVIEALNIGVKKIIITHPLFQATNMPIKKQIELSKLDGVFIELCYVNLSMDNLSIDLYVKVIEAIGPKNVILTTDLGQSFNESIIEGWRSYYNLLEKKGISKDNFLQMAVENPYIILE